MSDDAALLGRLSDHADALTQSFGLRAPVVVLLKDTEASEATVKLTNTTYQIDLSQNLTGFLQDAFAKIITDPDMIPWLPVEQDQAIGNLHPERGFAQRVLTRLCIDFVFLHEMAHIVGGHVDAKKARDNLSGGLSEFYLIGRAPDYDERAHAWEFEADTIAAALLDGAIDTLIHDAKGQKLNEDDRSFLGHPDIAVEHIGVMTISALYTLFRLLRETQGRLQKIGYHPDPLVRAFGCRDVILHRLSHRYEVDRERFDEMLIYHLMTFDDALSDCGVRSDQTVTDKGVDAVNEALKVLALLQTKHAGSTDGLRYFEWTISNL